MDIKLLTVDQVAERVGKDSRTVQRWCVRGILEGARKNGPFANSPWVVPETAVLDYEKKYLTSQPE